MHLRFICPHCHISIDPQTMEAGDGLGGRYRFCPDCDQPILVDTPEPTFKVSPECSFELATQSLPTITNSGTL
jgi:hypothetical protein